MSGEVRHTVRSRRLRALAAGAAVVGLGAAGTLAAWSDTEFVGALVSARGDFVVESSTAPTGPFESHRTATAALPLDLAGDSLRPGDSAQAEIWIRMRSDSTGGLSVKAPITADYELHDYLIVEVADAACGAGGELLQSGALGSLAAAPDALTLPAGTDGKPGEAQALCVTVTVAETVTQLGPGTYSTGSLVWEFPVVERAEG